MVLALVQAGAPQAADDTTALHEAARRNDLQAADRLVKSGADARKANRIGAMIDRKFSFVDTANTTNLDSCTHNYYKSKVIKIKYDRKA